MVYKAIASYRAGVLSLSEGRCADHGLSAQKPVRNAFPSLREPRRRGKSPFYRAHHPPPRPQSAHAPHPGEVGVTLRAQS